MAKAKKTSKATQPAKLEIASSDLQDVIPAIGKGFGIKDLGAAIAFYKQHQGLIATILSFFGIGKKKNAPPVAVPAPVPEGVPAPAPAPAPPTDRQRTPTSLNSALFLVEKKNNPRKAGGGRFIADKETFEEIKAKTSPARRGDRLHINTTPKDGVGVFQPGGPENRSLLMDPNDPTGPLGKSRIEHVLTGGAELTSEYDDYGCTPVLLIPWEKEPGVPFPIDTGEDWKVTYQAIYRGPNGETVEGNVVTVLVEE